MSSTLNDRTVRLETSSLSNERRICKDRIPQNKITFAIQIIAIYSIIIASVINLSLQHPDKELWLILLSSCIGYVLPNPGLKYKKRTLSYLMDAENDN